MPYYRPARLILAAAPSASGRRLWLQICLTLLLLLAQTGLFLHELEHQSTAPDAYCALCLAAQHLGDALHTALIVSVTVPPAFAPLHSTTPSVHAAPRMPFSARAPPPLVLV